MDSRVAVLGLNGLAVLLGLLNNQRIDTVFGPGWLDGLGIESR